MAEFQKDASIIMLKMQMCFGFMEMVHLGEKSSQYVILSKTHCMLWVE